MPLWRCFDTADTFCPARTPVYASSIIPSAGNRLHAKHTPAHGIEPVRLGACSGAPDGKVMLTQIDSSVSLRSTRGTWPRPLRPLQQPDLRDARELEVDLRNCVRGEIRFDEGSRALYCTDGSNYREIPIGVVLPRDADDVEATISACRRHGRRGSSVLTSAGWGRLPVSYKPEST